MCAATGGGIPRPLPAVLAPGRCCVDSVCMSVCSCERRVESSAALKRSECNVDELAHDGPEYDYRLFACGRELRRRCLLSGARGQGVQRPDPMCVWDEKTDESAFPQQSGSGGAGVDSAPASLLQWISDTLPPSGAFSPRTDRRGSCVMSWNRSASSPV